MKIFAILYIIAAICFIGYLLHIGTEERKSHIHTAPLRVYQIEIESRDTFSVWDGNRLVGKCFLTDDSEIGNLIIYDQK